MKIKNNRLYMAAREIICGKGDARSRVVAACKILERINKKELSIDLKIRLEEVLIEAGRKGAERDRDGNVLEGRDRFENTALHSRNARYTKLAEKIYKIYIDELND